MSAEVPASITKVTTNTTELNDTTTGGWYIVRSSVEISSRVTVSGNVHLILANDCELDAMSGINVSKGNRLTIYAQSNGNNMGALNATGSGTYAGIGGGFDGDGFDGGTITINGGDVTATSKDGAGIGGGDGGAGGEIAISGGTVRATSSVVGAGIGGGMSGAGGTININGGKVTANSDSSSVGDGGAGIGGGDHGEGGEITISGGVVTATGNTGAGIGGGNCGKGGKITISGGTVEATSSEGAGIGGGDGGQAAISPRMAAPLSRRPGLMTNQAKTAHGAA